MQLLPEDCEKKMHIYKSCVCVTHVYDVWRFPLFRVFPNKTSSGRSGALHVLVSPDLKSDTLVGVEYYFFRGVEKCIIVRAPRARNILIISYICNKFSYYNSRHFSSHPFRVRQLRAIAFLIFKYTSNKRNWNIFHQLLYRIFSAPFFINTPTVGDI